MKTSTIHLAFTEPQRRSLRKRLQAGSLEVGDVVELPGRRVTIRGFDPWGVEGRRIYLEETDGAVGFSVRVEDVER